MGMKDVLFRTGQKTVAVIESTEGVMAIGLVGMSDDRPAKVMVGVGMVGLGVAALATTPVVVKVAVGTSMVMFTTGFIRGFRRGWSLRPGMIG